MNRFLTSDGSSIAYKDLGTGTPIIFLHGWGVEHRLWLNRIEAIRGPWKKKYRRIYLDLPGMGKSIASRSIGNSDDMLRAIEELAHFLIGDGSYILAGESYGAYLSRGLLVKQLGRVKGMFLLCPLMVPGYRKGRVSEKLVLEKDDGFLSSLSEVEKNEFAYLSVIQNEKMWRLFKKDIKLKQLKENAGFLERRLDGSFGVDPNQVNIVFEQPVLVLLGRQDTEVGFEDQYEMYKNYRRASIMVLDCAGHNLQIERFDLFKQSFLDLLQRIEKME